MQSLFDTYKHNEDNPLHLDQHSSYEMNDHRGNEQKEGPNPVCIPDTSSAE